MPKIPAVLLVDDDPTTNSVSPRDQQRAQELPIAAYFDKPLTQQQVEHIVAQHFAE